MCLDVDTLDKVLGQPLTPEPFVEHHKQVAGILHVAVLGNNVIQFDNDRPAPDLVDKDPCRIGIPQKKEAEGCLLFLPFPVEIGEEILDIPGPELEKMLEKGRTVRDLEGPVVLLPAFSPQPAESGQ